MLEKQLALPIISNKSFFLNNLSSKSKYKYSRYSRSPIRYAGGKSLGVGHIVEQIPENVSGIVSPFIGGGSVEIACANELGMSVLGFDIFDILTTYWKIQISKSEELANFLSDWEPSKEKYEEIKKSLKLHWSGKSVISEPLELAAHYWYNHNLSYGPNFLGWMSSVFESEDKYERLLKKVRCFKAPFLTVETASFEEVIPEYDYIYLYCDPPYYLEDGEVFKGMYPQRNFPIHHVGFNHELLRDLLHNHKNGFVLSYNDCQLIREWYKDFKIIEVKWQYTMGQGETRIGKNRKERGDNHVKKSHELIIVKDN